MDGQTWTRPIAWVAPPHVVSGRVTVRDRRRLRWILGALLVVVAALGVGVVLSGCAHLPGRPREYVAYEAAGGVVAPILTRLNGGRQVDAVTLGGRTVYLRNADDPCLAVHEATHRRQRDELGARFEAEWVHEYEAHGYDGNRFEREAAAAQAACEEARS